VQPLHAERRLSLADAHAERRREDRVEIRVVHDQCAAGEVRVQIELEPTREAAAHVRPQPPDRERIDDRLVVVVDREPALGVQQQAELQAEVAVGRLDGDAVGPGRHRRQCRCRCRCLRRGIGAGHAGLAEAQPGRDQRADHRVRLIPRVLGLRRMRQAQDTQHRSHPSTAHSGIRVDRRRGGLVDDADGGAGNRRTERITDEAGDRARHHLGERTGRQQRQHERRCELQNPERHLHSLAGTRPHIAADPSRIRPKVAAPTRSIPLA
jgi:hypothetical protein